MAFSLVHKLADIANQKMLVEVTENNLDLFRTGREFNRAQSGIYRSLEEKERVRDETVWMTYFCFPRQGH